MKRSDCPAFEVDCDFCGIKGHFKRVCKKFLANGGDGQIQNPPASNTSHQLEAAGTESEQLMMMSERSPVASSVSYIFVNNTATTNNNDTSQQPPVRARCTSKNVPVPHMEWTGSQFEKMAPPPPPKLILALEVVTDPRIFPMLLSLPSTLRTKSVTTTT